MQGYVAVQDRAFAESRKCFRELEDWMASEEAAGLQHAELEDQLDVRGRELLRRLFQDRLDLTAAREERRHDVRGEDGVVRTRAEKGRARPLVTRFGQVSVSRIAYRSPGRSNVHPLDAALNLPGEKHSHGLRKLTAIEAARGSVDAAGAAITRATGVRIGKRQLEEMVRRAAAHVEAFYLSRVIKPAPDGHPLVLTFDGKGIVMRPEALRPATAKAAAAAEGKLATRLSPGEKHGRKRMAELACVYDAVPVPRAPEDIISTPAQKRRKKKKAQAGTAEGKGKPREPRAGASPSRSSSTSSTCSNTCGTPPGPSTTRASRQPRNGSLTRPARSWPAPPARSRPGSAAAPPPTATHPPSAPVPTNAPATWTTRRTTWITPRR